MNMTRLAAGAILAILSGAPALAEMTLSSPELTEGGTLPEAQVFNGFGCTGANLSPALVWDGLPEGTQSLALTLFDPDAPTGSGWWHWTVADIAPGAKGLAGGAGSGAAPLPEGAVQGRTDFGSAGYGGACPPAGDTPHHYIFTLYALKVPKLGIDAGASGAMVGFLARANALDQASLTVTYGR